MKTTNKALLVLMGFAAFAVAGSGLAFQNYDYNPTTKLQLIESTNSPTSIGSKSIYILKLDDDTTMAPAPRIPLGGYGSLEQQ